MRSITIKIWCGHKNIPLASETEQNHLQALKHALADLPDHVSGEDIQSVVYAVGKAAEMKICDWFKCLYECYLARQKGPVWDRSLLIWPRQVSPAY